MVLGRSWAGLWEVPGGSLEVSWAFLGGPGGPRGVLGAALGGSWVAYHSLGLPGAPSGIHWGFLELIILCFWEVNFASAMTTH